MTIFDAIGKELGIFTTNTLPNFLREVGNTIDTITYKGEMAIADVYKDIIKPNLGDLPSRIVDETSNIANNLIDNTPNIIDSVSGTVDSVGNSVLKSSPALLMGGGLLLYILMKK